MKNVIETLQEKYNNVVRNDKAKLAKFLKRRRIELGYTLEEASEGICSTSYLSKIENCQVEVDDNYYSMLFERLNLEYNAVVENRMVPVYPDLIKAYLMNDIEYITTSVNDLVNKNTYCETEIELLVIIYNLTTGHYEEVKESIRKLELVKNTLSLDELVLLSFLNVAYFYKTYDLENVSKNLNVILESSQSDEVVHFAVMDLALDYYFTIGHKATFAKMYQEFLSSSFSKAFKRVDLIHSLQNLVFLGCEGNNVEKEFALLKNITEKDDMPVYNYYYAMYLIEAGNAEKAYLILREEKATNKILSLMAAATIKQYNVKQSLEFVQILRTFDFKESSPYYDFLEYVRLKFERYDINQLHAFLKNEVLPRQSVYNNQYLKDIELVEYQKIAYDIGRYKELVRYYLKNK